MAISPVAAAEIDDDTLTIPAHNAGALVLVVCYRSGSSSANGSPGGTELTAGGNALNYARVHYWISDGTLSSVSSTNSTAIACVIYRCEGEWETPTAAGYGPALSSSSLTYQGLSRPDSDNVWFVRFGGHRTATNMLANVPSGWTARSTSNVLLVSMDTNGLASVSNADQVGGNSQSVNGNSSWRTMNVALREYLPPSTGAIAAAIPAPTAALEGEETPPPSIGTITSALPAASAALEGKHGQTGSLAGSLPEVSVEAAGGIGQSGALGAALTPAQHDAAGGQGMAGQLQADVPPVESATAGFAPTAGTLVTEAAPTESTLDGEHTSKGSLESAIPHAHTDAAGDHFTPDGPFAAVITPATADLVSVHRQDGELASHIPALDTEQDGEAGFVGGVDATLQGLHARSRYGLAIPPVATVFGLTGLWKQSKMDQHFQAAFSQPPYEFIDLDYPASLGKNSITTGVDVLDKAVMATAGWIIVIAQSQGAQVASRWMQTFATDPARMALASRLLFILTGNPMRATGGDGIGVREVDQVIGVATPTDLPWEIIDVARRYDGWADPPQDKSNSLAVRNANSGKFSLHSRYNEIDIFDSSHTIWRIGSTTFVLTQEDLPYLRGKWWVPATVRSQMEQKVEEGYTNRPAGDPPVIVTPTQNWFWQVVNSFHNITT